MISLVYFIFIYKLNDFIDNIKKMNNWSWDRLKIVLAILDEGGVTEGARKLGLSQPAVTHAIRKLESEIGIRVFSRHKKRFELTQAGQKVAEIARKVAELCAELDPVVSALNQTDVQWLRIGVSSRVDRGSAVEHLSRYYERAHLEDTVRMQIRTGSHSELIPLLHTNELDLLITAEAPQFAGSEKDDAVLVATFDIPVRLFVARKSEWSQIGSRPGLQSEDFLALLKSKFPQGLPVLIPDRSHPFRQELDRFVETHELPLRPVLEADVFAALSSALMSGMGFCFLPESWIAENVNKIRAIGPEEGFWRQNILLLRGQNAHLPEKIDEIGSFLTHSWTFGLDRSQLMTEKESL